LGCSDKLSKSVGSNWRYLLVWICAQASIVSGIAKGLNIFHNIKMAAVGAIDFFADLWLNIGSAPPTVTAIATEMI
jgi:hypothetical protein